MIYAQKYRPNTEYKFSSLFHDFNPFHKNDLSVTGSRQTRRIILPDDKGRRSRYESDLDDFDDYEDDQAYTVGAQIQVQHPTPKYKKNSDKSNIATSFAKYQISHDSLPLKIKSTKQKLVKKPLFKSARDFDSESEESYIIVGKKPEDFKSDYKKPKISYPLEFEAVASKKQIAEYLEDQHKILDEVLQLRLLNDPNPEARAKYQQFLKAKDDERIEKEYLDELKRKPLALFTPNIESKRRLPRKNQPKMTNIHPPPLPPPRKSLGLNGFRNNVPLSMTFHVDV